MAFLYGRARRLTAKNGGFRPGQVSTDIATMASIAAGSVKPARAFLSGAIKLRGTRMAFKQFQVARPAEPPTPRHANIDRSAP
jgi:hypothetical protein